MKKDYSKLGDLTDKKLRTLRNNINNRLEAFSKGNEKNLPPSHMLFGMDDGECRELLKRIQAEMKNRVF